MAASKASKAAKAVKTPVPDNLSKPVGNFPKTDLDTDEGEEENPENTLPKPSTFLEDPQEFIDAVEADGKNHPNIHIAVDVLKQLLGIIPNPYAAIAGKVLDTVDADIK